MQILTNRCQSLVPQAGQMSISILRIVGATVLLICLGMSVLAQRPTVDEEGFGPVVQAYLGYLKNEQEVVDDRVSRHEVSASYYRRNSNRIRALRQMALRIARESHNDYLPELEAVAKDEFRLLFERPHAPQSFRTGEIYRGTFRFLGTVRSAEVFYIFARLDPYEQAEIQEKATIKGLRSESQPVAGSSENGTRIRRTNVP